MKVESTNVQDTQESPAIAKLLVICRFFGHKIGELNDSGYPVCERCGCHSYYDTDNWNRAALLMRPIWFVQGKIYQLKYNVKYWYRRIFLGDTLPF
jgi:hypothetical protein